MTDPLHRFTARLGAALVEEAHVRAASPASTTGPDGRMPRTTSPDRRGRPPWSSATGVRRGRRLAGAVSLAAVAGALVVVAVLALRGPAPEASAGLGPTLEAAARRVTGAPGPGGLAPGRFYYTRIDVLSRSPLDPARAKASVVEEWTARDGSGMSMERPGDVARLRAQARPFLVGGRTISYRRLAALPTDPARLDRRLRELVATNRTEPADVPPRTVALVVARDLARAPVPTGVRAALLRVLARTPGLSLRRGVRDHAGRTGVAVSADYRALRFVVVIDPSDGTVLETRRVLLWRSDQFPGYPVGTVSRATFLRTAVTATAGEQP